MCFSLKHHRGNGSQFLPHRVSRLIPELAIYRFGANLYYANESRVTEEILELVKKASPKLKWFCLSASMISDVDYPALNQSDNFMRN